MDEIVYPGVRGKAMGTWHLGAEDAMDARAIIFPYYVAVAKMGRFDNRVGCDVSSNGVARVRADG